MPDDVVTAEERKRYHDFSFMMLGKLGRKPKDIVWHYTDAQGLMGILNSKSIFLTQVACLNDALEAKYFNDLLLARQKSLSVSAADDEVIYFLDMAARAIENADFASFGRFVACFSEAKDDLGQWRGYGGGECGFAIGFSVLPLIRAANTKNALFLPLEYEDQKHGDAISEIVFAAIGFYLDGLKSRSDRESWANAFLMIFAEAIGPAAAMIKHPAFKSEKEFRIVSPLYSGEIANLAFTAKRTLLARHLPMLIEIEGRLPISEIMVGPGPAQDVNRVSVGDLLQKHGLKDIPVIKSAVPYKVR